MAFHIRDARTDAAVRKLAHRKGVGITEAVREAVEHELERDDNKLSLWERTADLRAEVMKNADPDFTPDKAFYDALSGQEDD